jgi:fucose permease
MLVSVVVGLEFCLVFYAPQLLRVGAGIPTPQAAALLSFFYAGELGGRAAGGFLTRRPGGAGALIVLGLAVTAAGVLTIWVSGRAWLAAPGLLVAGLGVANLYPLALALALGAAGEQTDLANARVQLLVGAAVLAAPLALGLLADRLGVERAFALVIALIATALPLISLPCAARRLPPGDSRPPAAQRGRR